MNTIIGFACAMGVDMGFNSKHHNEDDEVTEAMVHVHANTEIHEHEQEESKEHHHSHEGSEKGGCCNDSVIKFQSLDKSLGSNANASINHPVFVTIITNFYSTDIFNSTKVPAQKHLRPFFHPPPPDIRILIQSFQI